MTPAAPLDVLHAVFGFEARDWGGVATGGGELQRFVVARDLE